MFSEQSAASALFNKREELVAVEVKNLSFSYREQLALKNISFSVVERQIFGFLGPNGGGKTTLFLILSTLLHPDEGDVTIAGVSVKKTPNAARRKIGVVFQSNSTDIELTSKENLISQGHIYGLRGQKLRRRVEDLLTSFGMLDRRNDLVKTLSGGLRRRLELAKGLLHDPQILLLDEPTTGLDPGGRHDFWKYLERLRDEEGRTILFTTHLMEEAERCDELAVLNKGCLVATGTPATLKSKVGGDVIVVQTKSPQHLCDLIGTRFNCDPVIVGKTIRLELPLGHQFVPKLIEAFPGQIISVTVGKPTIEDVFIRETGHRFWVGEE